MAIAVTSSGRKVSSMDTMHQDTELVDDTLFEPKASLSANDTWSRASRPQMSLAAHSGYAAKFWAILAYKNASLDRHLRVRASKCALAYPCYVHVGLPPVVAIVMSALQTQ